MLLAKPGRRHAIDFRRAALDSASVAAKGGGAATGPNPTDRGKAGPKRHVLADANGIPLAVGPAGANVHDSTMLETLADAGSSIRRCRGPPRRRPGKLRADKAWDHRRCRRAPTRPRLQPRIARRGIESSAKPGRHRRVMERTLAWLAQVKRLAVRCERRADLHLAPLILAAALIAARFVQRWCG